MRLLSYKRGSQSKRGVSLAGPCDRRPGEVGFYIAGRLSEEGKDVVVIDRNEKALQRVAETLDVMTILGYGGSARVLEQGRHQTSDHADRRHPKR